jgi:hypothetical protein
MIFSTKQFVDATLKRLGAKVIQSFQEGNKIVVRYVDEKGNEQTLEITPSVVNEAVTPENLWRKLGL